MLSPRHFVMGSVLKKGTRPQERQEYGQSIEGRHGKVRHPKYRFFDRIGL